MTAHGWGTDLGGKDTIETHHLLGEASYQSYLTSIQLGASRVDHPIEQVMLVMFSLNTPWKFNIAPENIPSQKESSLPTIIFQGLC